MSQPPDLLDSIIGATAESPISRLRAQRPDIVRHTQGSYDVLLFPDDPAGLSFAERAAVALQTAELSGHAALTAQYRGLVTQRGNPPDGARRDAILSHSALVATNPRTATPANLAALQASGLGPRDIVALTQIVAFVSYQVRAAAGLALLAQEMAA